jgi:hypothetical protein
MFKRLGWVLILLMVFSLAISGCKREGAGLPNPASVYCEEQGGVLEIREGDDGQTGVCVFPDGSECEEWAFYNGECAPGGEDEEQPLAPAGLANPASVYCQGLGYREETREGAEGQYGVCIFPDGSECDTWDFLAGRCGQAFSYCVQQGYTLEVSEGNIGNCILSEEQSCPEYDYYQGTCPAQP